MTVVEIPEIVLMIESAIVTRVLHVVVDRLKLASSSFLVRDAGQVLGADFRTKRTTENHKPTRVAIEVIMGEDTKMIEEARKEKFVRRRGLAPMTVATRHPVPTIHQ
jgi:hypothetical protein